MRIISKFKDYYDSGQFYGIDQSRIYVRETIRKTWVPRAYYQRKLCVVGFCGKLYPFVNYTEHIQKNNKDRNAKYYTLYEDDIFKYSFDEILNRNNSTNDVVRIDFDETIALDKFKKYWFSKTLKQEYDEMCTDKDLLALFLKYKTPTFLYTNDRKDNLIINPCLKDYAFFKVTDTIQAYQEIEQFVSNELASLIQPNMPVGNDEIVGTSKGFDRYSFRNAKKKPKKF